MREAMNMTWKTVAVAITLFGLNAATSYAQQGGCQRGGGGGAGGGGTTTSTGAANVASMRLGGGGTTGGGTSATSALSGLQSYQLQGLQFRQAQLQALAANAQIRASSQAMWDSARQRKQQALALRQSREMMRTGQ